MTGFGRAALSSGTLDIVAEARSVNQKGLVIHLSVPESLERMEELLRESVRTRLSRGRIDISITLSDRSAAGAGGSLDLDRARTLAEAVGVLSEELGIPPGLEAADLLRVPGVVIDPGRAGSADPAPVLECLSLCLEDLIRSRRAEGAAISEMVASRLDRLESLAAEVAVLQKDAAPLKFSRLRERVAALAGDASLDEQRLALELALIADRLDVTEEMDRLACHVATSRSLVLSDEPDSGRKLGFLLQEIQREVNTLGSKLETPASIHLVVEMKNEVSALREQAANVE